MAFLLGSVDVPSGLAQTTKLIFPPPSGQVDKIERSVLYGNGVDGTLSVQHDQGNPLDDGISNPKRNSEIHLESGKSPKAISDYPRSVTGVNIAPTVTITGVPPKINSRALFNVQLRFSENVTGANSGIAAVKGGSVTAFVVNSGSVYNLGIYPSGNRFYRHLYGND